MKASIYTPTKLNRNWTDAESAEVEFETTIDALLDTLEQAGAPEGLRVVVYHRGTTHYVYERHRWKLVLKVHE